MPSSFVPGKGLKESCRPALDGRSCGRDGRDGGVVRQPSNPLRGYDDDVVGVDVTDKVHEVARDATLDRLEHVQDGQSHRRDPACINAPPLRLPSGRSYPRNARFNRFHRHSRR